MINNRHREAHTRREAVRMLLGAWLLIPVPLEVVLLAGEYDRGIGLQVGAGLALLAVHVPTLRGGSASRAVAARF